MNYNAFTTEITKQDIAAFEKEYKAARKKAAPTKRFAGLQLEYVATFAVLGVFVGSMLLNFVFSAVQQRTFPTGALVIVALLAALYAAARFVRRREYRKGILYQRFARDNSLRYSHRDISIPQQGAIFTAGHSKYRQFVLEGEQFEFGNYHYTTGSGRSRQSHAWAYLAITLDREMPHMLLDAKKNNASLFGANISNLPHMFKRSQQLQLEGDFNKHFTLYVPPEYEADALYIFTPDVMALLIDHGADCDIEVVGNQIFVYLPQLFKGEKSQIEFVQTLREALLAKVKKRTTNYLRHTDEAHVASAPRLQKSVPTVTIIIGILYVAYLLFSFASGLLGR